MPKSPNRLPSSQKGQGFPLYLSLPGCGRHHQVAPLIICSNRGCKMSSAHLDRADKTPPHTHTKSVQRKPPRQASAVWRQRCRGATSEPSVRQARRYRVLGRSGQPRPVPGRRGGRGSASGRAAQAGGRAASPEAGSTAAPAALGLSPQLRRLRAPRRGGRAGPAGRGGAWTRAPGGARSLARWQESLASGPPPPTRPPARPAAPAKAAAAAAAEAEGAPPPA